MCIFIYVRVCIYFILFYFFPFDSMNALQKDDMKLLLFSLPQFMSWIKLKSHVAPSNYVSCL